MNKNIYFAAIGDVHGQMNKMVSMLQRWESSKNMKLAFVLQVGDFEPHRDKNDLNTMAAPAKYRKLGDFHNYYKNILKFPWPVYFIAGNHEPYGFLDQHIEGIEICSNCYYIGRANSFSINNIKVSGLSGIYKENVFRKKRPHISEIERSSNKDYIYFTDIEVDKLIDFGKTDILLLHDWPEGIINQADAEQFEAQRRSIRYNTVGNEYSKMVMELTEPQIVLCGHLHQKYRNQIILNNGTKIQIICMASVTQGWDSIAFFTITKNNQIELLLS
jgi:Icc-related predicted phosphoesterase